MVIFLDDLQWIDKATLRLIELLIADEELKSLFLIGSYRDSEIDAAYPLAIRLDVLQKRKKSKLHSR